MIVAVRIEKGLLYIDKEIFSRKQPIQDEFGNFIPLFTEEELAKPPYNYTKVEIEDIYSDCETSDFNEDLTFSPIKYIDRKQREKDEIRIAEIKPRLEQLSQDIVQSLAGAKFDDLEERKQEFQTLHNELRILLGKMPRQYN